MTTAEQITYFEGKIRESQDSLVKLYEQRVAETRIMSDEVREEILEDLAQGVDGLKTSEVVELSMCTQLFSQGWADYADAELLELWFDCSGPNPKEILGSPLWKDHLSNNLGVVAEFGKWLNKQKT
jgi:hypothetical protein